MIYWHRYIEMLVPIICDDAATRSASQESELDQVRFVDVFDGLYLFASNGRECLDTGGTTFELMDEGVKNVTVSWFETEMVNFVQIERFTGKVPGNGRDIFYFRMIADAGSLAATSGNLFCS